MPTRSPIIRLAAAPSAVVKRSILLGGRNTSVSLEDEFWTALKEIAIARNTTVSRLIATIDQGREQVNLSSTLRLFVLRWFRERVGTNAAEHLERVEAAE
jgi:predicted DNA-binding ribbon-helix-helix protein